MSHYSAIQLKMSVLEEFQSHVKKVYAKFLNIPRNMSFSNIRKHLYFQLKGIS